MILAALALLAAPAAPPQTPELVERVVVLPSIDGRRPGALEFLHRLSCGAGRPAPRLLRPRGLPPAPGSLRAWLGSPLALGVTGVSVAPRADAGAALPNLDDDFESGVLAADWELFNPQLANLSVSGGELHVEPTQSGPAVTWYANGQGPAVYRRVTGDFTVTARVRSRSIANPTQPPPVSYNMGGLNVRDPGSLPGAHNWVHVALGGGVPGMPVTVEDKSTWSSTSSLLLYPIAEPEGELRITRQGEWLSLWYRPLDDPTWQLLRAHHHPLMPSTVQVGAVSFMWSGAPDIRTSFDEIRFR